MADTNLTGQNTKMGGLVLVFKLKGTNRALTTDENVREVFVHMISQSVLELREHYLRLKRCEHQIISGLITSMCYLDCKQACFLSLLVCLCVCA